MPSLQCKSSTLHTHTEWEQNCVCDQTDTHPSSTHSKWSKLLLKFGHTWKYSTHNYTKTWTPWLKCGKREREREAIENIYKHLNKVNQICKMDQGYKWTQHTYTTLSHHILTKKTSNSKQKKTIRDTAILYALVTITHIKRFISVLYCFVDFRLLFVFLTALNTPHSILLLLLYTLPLPALLIYV